MLHDLVKNMVICELGMLPPLNNLGLHEARVGGDGVHGGSVSKIKYKFSR